MLDRGDYIVFGCRFVHGGSSYATMNYRLFAYLGPKGFTVGDTTVYAGDYDVDLSEEEDSIAENQADVAMDRNMALLMQRLNPPLAAPFMDVLHRQYGVIGIAMPKDGACLFWALGRNTVCSIGRQDILIDAKFMRERVVRRLRENREEYEPYLTDWTGTYDAYCDYMALETTWGDELELKVSNDDMASSAGMNAQVLGMLVIDGNDESGYTITVNTQYPGVEGGNYLVYHRGTHYDFACAEQKLKAPIFGGALIRDDRMCKLLDVPKSFVRPQQRMDKKMSSTQRGGYLRPPLQQQPAAVKREQPEPSAIQSSDRIRTPTKQLQSPRLNMVRAPTEQLLSPTSSTTTEVLPMDDGSLEDSDREDKDVSMRTDLWCVTVGTALYSGEAIVRDITSYKKRFKYLPKDCRNCIGTITHSNLYI